MFPWARMGLLPGSIGSDQLTRPPKIATSKQLNAAIPDSPLPQGRGSLAENRKKTATLDYNRIPQVGRDRKDSFCLDRLYFARDRCDL
ncbi:hypothetical protein Ddc_13913 [Ditylenchus destructor]|nr:hypothetical protein Ddc_13913 [Ditylenchus destructor]